MSKGLIIMPAYNEAENIERTLDELLILELNIDIVVINDGSKDRTESIAKSKGIKVISHPFNIGYGGALQTGYKYALKAGYDYVIQFDADGQHNSANLCSMIESLEKKEADIIIGSRFIEGGSFKIGFIKKFVINIMSAAIRITAKKKITDPTSGFKGYQKEIFTYYSKYSNFPEDYPDADILIKMLKMGYTVKEIPINVRQREHGESMHSGLKPVLYLIQILISIFIITLRNEKPESKGE